MDKLDTLLGLPLFEYNLSTLGCRDCICESCRTRCTECKISPGCGGPVLKCYAYKFREGGYE